MKHELPPRVVWLAAVLACALSMHVQADVVCPPKCVCTETEPRQSVVDEDAPSSSLASPILLQIQCRDELDSVAAAGLAVAVTGSQIELDLSGNAISSIGQQELAALALNAPQVTKLSLRNNIIQWIEDEAFYNLTELKMLDLGYNQLRTVNSSMFKGLNKLDKLNLEGNKISRLPEGTFDALISLHSVNLSDNLLVCDCKLHWLPRWSRKKNINFHGSVCQYPIKMKGKPLKQLKKKELHCNWPQQPLKFEINPAVSQVVFQGDQLKFRCLASHVMDSTEIIWYHNGREVVGKNNLSSSIILELEETPEGNTINSSLLISQLTTMHTGAWACHMNLANGNRSLSVNIVVISNNVKHCPQTVTVNNKGRYIWPKTVVGITVELPCESPQLNTMNYQPSQAFYTCTQQEQWEYLNTSFCPFVSEVTKILEQFSKTNLSISSKGGVVENAKRLRNYTSDVILLRDKMDIVFIARTVENYLDYISWHKEIGEILIDVVSTLMRVDQKLLRAAQKEDKSCSRLIKAVEKIPELVTNGALNRYRDNIAVEEFIINPNSFSGMSCTSYVRVAPNGARDSEISYNEKVFKCNTVDESNIPDTVEDKVIEASIQLPASIFKDLEKMQNLQFGNSQKLQFAIYRNSKLFPFATDFHYKNSEITTSIISSRLVKIEVTNLSDPIIVRLRIPTRTDDITPVWWDFSANDNFRDWSNEGCKIRTTYNNLVVFQCNRLANFGLMQDVNQLALSQSRLQGAKFHFSHPSIYVGSTVCICCLLIVIITYVVFCKSLKMPKKAIHSLVNTWLSLTLLCFLFSVGIYQTENPRVCQAIGLLLHYFSLCSFFWMMITVSNMYKKLTKQEPPESPSEEPLPPKPMLRFYLIGWGIAIIICGISAAVNMEDYAGYYYCFLAFGPSLGAFYGPCSALVFFLCIFFCLIHCVINSLKGRVERATSQGLEAVDLEMTAPSENPDVRSTNSSNIDDLEHPPILQLRAHAVVLLLFLLTWASAAIAVAQPFADHISQGEAIFSCIYSVLSSTLGVFVLIFFCYSRQDVRTCWKRLKRCRRRREVYDTGHSAPPLTTSNGHIRQSTHSLESSFTNKSSHTSRSVDGASKTGSGKLPNINIVVASQMGGVDPVVTGAEIFFNPRQNGIARRFFEKNRQQQLKLTQYNNIGRSTLNGEEEKKKDHNSYVPLNQLQGKNYYKKTINANENIQTSRPMDNPEPKQTSIDSCHYANCNVPSRHLVSGNTQCNCTNDKLSMSGNSLDNNKKKLDNTNVECRNVHDSLQLGVGADSKDEEHRSRMKRSKARRHLNKDLNETSNASAERQCNSYGVNCADVVDDDDDGRRTSKSYLPYYAYTNHVHSKKSKKRSDNVESNSTSADQTSLSHSCGACDVLSDVSTKDYENQMCNTLEENNALKKETSV